MKEAKTELTLNELTILTKLAEAWNTYTELEILHSSDATEFQQAIHQAQNIVMARPIMRKWRQKAQKSA